MSGSPDLQATDANADPEQMARDDPLATQVWKMYARTKATLPHAQRMENLTWRMMALALKKKKEDEEARLVAEMTNEDTPGTSGPEDGTGETARRQASKELNAVTLSALDERGRRADKGKSKVRVVGFDGKNQDGFEEEE